jgi:hypothetical protein
VYVGEFLCVKSIVFLNEGDGVEWGIGASSRAVGTVDRERCADSPLKSPRMHKNFHR